MKRRIVYRKINDEPIIEEAPSYERYQYTNQVLINDKWEFFNRYTGKFGTQPIVWYTSIEWAEQNAPNCDIVNEMIEWGGIDDYQNTFITELEPINIKDLD